MIPAAAEAAARSSSAERGNTRNNEPGATPQSASESSVRSCNASHVTRRYVCVRVYATKPRWREKCRQFKHKFEKTYYHITRKRT